MIELLGRPGSGTRRFALHFAKPARRVAWLSRQWNLHAPLLWQMARDEGMDLLGIECEDASRLRFLWKELLSSEALDAWVLDDLQLREADGFFLERLTRAQPLRLLILDDRPLNFCRTRIHISRSHDRYRLFYSKGGPPTPIYFSETGEPPCLP